MSFDSKLRSDLPIVVKIGGSLITNKAGYCELNSEKAVAVGREIAALDPALCRRLIVLIGGGSFSHGIALKYGLVDVRPQTVRADFARITIGMFRMMSTIAELWRDVGVSTYPIQAATIVRIEAGELRLTADYFLTSMASQLVPVTTGDIAPLPDGSSYLVASDWLPVLIAREIAIACAVFLTDVPGIIDMATGNSIPTVTLNSAGLARASAVTSSKPDVTGGMALKLKAALALAELGVCSRIVDGRQTGTLGRALSSVGWCGTEIVP